MQKLFHFDSESGLYRADAVAVWCFDDRFTLAAQKFLKRRGVGCADSIRVAGGAKSLASPREESDRRFVIEQIRLSRKLHGAERVILMSHSDCGAYGGIAAFEGDAAVEADHHRGELERAAACVRSNLEGVTADCFFVDFTGVWEVQTDAHTRSAGGSRIS
jgi:hypothetical protein